MNGNGSVLTGKGGMTMPDREKVIKGLEQCISTDKTCEGCPYEGTTCTTTLNADALELLREQEQEISFLKAMQLQTIKGMDENELGNIVGKTLGLFT